MATMKPKCLPFLPTQDRISFNMTQSIPERMKAVIKPAPGPGLELVELPVPEIGPGEVLVRVRAASICGTDLHIYRWDEWAQNRIKPPLGVGHEITGEVAAVAADVTTLGRASCRATGYVAA